MKIQEKMALLMKFVVLVSGMVSPGVESRWDVQGSSLHDRIDSREMAEFLKTNCRLKLLHAKKNFRDLKLCVKEEEELFTSWSSRGKTLITGDPSRAKQIVRNCLSKKLVLPDTRNLLASHHSSTGRKLAQMLAEVSDVQSSEQKTSKRTVVVAIVVTAGVTLIVSALLFFCWRRFGRGRNNKRRLHSSSLHDCSIDKSFRLGTQMNEEDSQLNQNKISGTFYVASHSVKDSEVEIPVGTFSVSTAYSAEEIGQLQPGEVAYFPPPNPPPPRPPPPLTPPGPPPAKPSYAGPCPSPATFSAVKTGLNAPTLCAPIPPCRPPPKNGLPPCAPITPPRPPPCAPIPPPRPPLKTGPHAAPPCDPIPLPRPPPCAPSPPPRPPSKTGPHAPPPFAPIPPPRPPPVGLKSAQAAPSHPSTLVPPKAKLKPFFWEKILANPDHSMVWHRVKSGSFKFNEEMIEKLFGHTPAGKNRNDAHKSSSQDLSMQYTRIIDPKKSQNLSILLKALNLTTEEIYDALGEGTELPPELIQTLLKMAPTAEEETKLRQYTGKVSQLSPAEQFLKALVDIPFAFKRLESLLFMCTLHEEMSMLKESFEVLEGACTELRKSRLFHKLLEAVLKTGNRLNDGTFRGGAEAFKLDTLLKLPDVKGTDRETTLLHFIVQEIIHSEGIRFIQATKLSQADNETQDSDQHDIHSIGLRIVSGLGGELEHVKKAADLDIDSLSEAMAKLGKDLVNVKDFWNSYMKNVAEENRFHRSLKSFVDDAEINVMWLVEEEKRIMGLVKNASDYFHRNAGKEASRLFVIVRDFIIIVDKICKELENVTKR